MVNFNDVLKGNKTRKEPKFERTLNICVTDNKTRMPVDIYIPYAMNGLDPDVRTRALKSFNDILDKMEVRDGGTLHTKEPAGGDSL